MSQASQQQPASSDSLSFQLYQKPPVTSTHKLRDSCDACASSKVKCHKEKPTCSRCMKRNIKCEYVASKRGGRAAVLNTNVNVNVNGNANATRTRTRTRQQSTPRSGETYMVGTPIPSNQPSSSIFDDIFLQSILAPAHVTSTSTSSDAGSGLQTPSVSSPLPNLDHLFTTTDSSSLFSSILTPLSTSTPPFATECLPDNLDDFLPDAFFLPDHVDTELIDQTSPLPNPDACADGSSSSHTTGSSLSSLNGGNSTTDSTRCSSISINDSPAHVQTEHKASSCCLFEALSLMRNLFHNPSEACGVFTDASSPHTVAIPTIEDAITKNQVTLEAIGRMLQCSCAHDAYLLAQISMMVFKVLAWYDAVARSSPPPQSEDTTILNLDSKMKRDRGDADEKKNGANVEKVHHMSGVVYNYHLNGEDSARMTAQLVLSELNRVQRLISVLEDRLRSILLTNKFLGGEYGDQFANDEGEGEEKARNGHNRHSPFSQEKENSWDEQMSSFSLLILARMVDHLKKRLKSLSSRIVRRLNSD